MSIFRFTRFFYGALLWFICVLGINNLTAQVDTSTLILPQQSACLGDTIIVPVTVSDFSDVSAFQFVLGWSASQLTYLEVCELAIGNSGDVVTPPSPPDHDRLQLTWVDFSGTTELTLADGDTLMLIKFVVESNLGAGATLFFADSENPTVPSREITVINDQGFFSYEPHIVNGFISQDQSIALLATATAISCRDSLAELRASSAQTQTIYSWSGPNDYVDSIAITTTSMAGIYTVIGQNGNCFDTTMVEVVFDTITPTGLSLFADTISCSEPLALLSGSVNEQNIDYRWFDATANVLGTASQLTTAEIGWYYFTATRQDNGCFLQDSIEVVDNLTPPDLIITNSDFELTCNIPDLTIYGTTNSDSVSWVWENMQGLLLSSTDSIVVSETGMYQVMITNTQNGCSDSLSFTVSENLTTPDFNIMGNQVLDCNNDSQWFQAIFDSNDNLDFNWLAADFSVLADADSVLLSEAGTYYLSGTDLTGGCADTLAFMLTQDTLPPMGTVSPNSATLDCNTNSLPFTLLADTTGLEILWEDINNNLFGLDSTEVMINEAGNYTVLLTDENNGCTNIVPFEVLIDTLPPTFTLNVPDTINCIQSEVEIIIFPDAADWLCEWDGLGNNCSVMVSSSGVYQATVTDPSNGCQSMGSLEVFAAPDTIAITLNSDMPYSLTCENDTILLQASSTTQNIAWTWLDENNMVISNTDSLSITAAGNYELMALEPGTGCEAVITFSVTQNTAPPVYSLNGLEQLDCSQETQVWNVSTNNTDLTYNWLNDLGMLLSTADSIVLNNPGSYTLVATDTLNGCTASNTFEITQDTLSPDLMLQLPIATLSCSVDAVLATFTTAVGAYSSSWQNEDEMTIGTTDSIMINTAGEYSLLLTNLDNGCSQTTPFSVMMDTLRPALFLTVSDTLDCEVQEVDLLISTSEPGLNCNWEGIGPDCQVTVAAPGWYQASVSNPLNGCSTLDSIEVIDLSSLFVAMVDPPDLLNCVNGTVSLIAQNTSANQSNEWLTPDGMLLSGDSIEVAEAGEYSLFAIDELSNCRDTITVLVSEDFTIPEGEASISNDLNCEETEASLQVDNLGANTQFVWLDDQNDTLTTTLLTTPGTYYLMLFDSLSQCTALDSVPLISTNESPPVNWMYLGDSILTCNQTTLMLQASNTGTNFDYSWINTLTGEELSTAATLIVTEPQTIQLTINDNNNGCTADTLLTIMENLSPPLAQITEVVPFNCASSEAVLAAAEPDNINNTYQWNAPQATTLPATPDSTSTLVFEAGTYILLVEDLSNGCQQADTLLVSNDAQAPNGITANVFNPGCSASTGSIIVQGITGGTSPYSYALGANPFSLATVFDSLVVGSYLLQVEDALGCTYDSLFTIEQNLLFDVFIDAPSGPYGIGDEITLTAEANQALTNADSLVWYRDGVLICANCLSVNDTLLASATYTLEAYSNDGCTATDVLFLPVSEVLNIYIPNAFSPNEDGTNDAFQIFPGAGVKSIQNLKIWDRWGGLIHEEADLNSLPATDWAGRMRNKLLPTGVYIYQFEVNLINGDRKNYQGEVLLLY